MTGREFDVIAAVAVPLYLAALGWRARFRPGFVEASNTSAPERPPLEPTLAPPSGLPKRVPGAIYEAIDDECKRYRLEAA